MTKKVFMLLLFIAGAASAAPKRVATIQWKQLPGAKVYDFQLSRSVQMIPQVLRRKFKSTSAKIKIPPGTYYFRVRGIDSGGAPGPWSEVQGFVVNPHPPKLVGPRHKTVYRDRVPAGGINFKWQSGIRGSDHKIEIRDASGVLLSRNIDGDEFKWDPQAAGVYKWRVGFETPHGSKEWSRYWAFKVGKVTTSELIEDVKRRDVGGKPGVWLIGRGAQSVVAYTALNLDGGSAGTSTSAAALASAFSGELRWRLGRQPRQNWLLSGSFNFEMLRQKLQGEDFLLPRFYGRLFYTRRSGKWRIGPLVHFQSGSSAIFLPQDEQTASQGTVSRTGLGVGGVAVYEAADTLYLSTLAMMRYDLGGSSNVISSPLDNTIGFEAGFGVVLSMGANWFVEGRLRVQQEGLEWTPVDPTRTGKSTFSNTFIIFDVGVGYKLF